MDTVTQLHNALGTDSIGFVFQAMASIAFTSAVVYAGSEALKIHKARKAAIEADPRFQFWPLSEKVTTNHKASELAEAMVQTMQDPYWSQAVRSIVDEAATRLNEIKPVAWGLDDLITEIRARQSSASSVETAVAALTEYFITSITARADAAEEAFENAEIDAYTWDPEQDYSHRVELMKNGQWLGK